MAKGEGFGLALLFTIGAIGMLLSLDAVGMDYVAGEYVKMMLFDEAKGL